MNSVKSLANVGGALLLNTSQLLAPSLHCKMNELSSPLSPGGALLLNVIAEALKRPFVPSPLAGEG